MKALILFIVILMTGLLPAQQTYVPDDNFEQALINIDLDTIPLNDSVPTKNIDTLVELQLNWKGVKDLTGIEDFISLEILSLMGSEITEIDLSNNTRMKILWLPDIQLTSLDLSKNKELEILNIRGSRLTEIDLSNNTKLLELLCFSIELEKLDISNNILLEVLMCGSCKLTSLDLSNNTALHTLVCNVNDLTSLDVKNNTELTEINCSDNALTSLDVSKNSDLVSLNCSWNNLTSLDVSKNSALTLLGCSDNALTSLDVSMNSGLEQLYCEDNTITSLDVSMIINLISLSCSSNPNLYCIQVADSVNAENNRFWYKDPQAVWSEDCSLISNVKEEMNTFDISISPNPATDYIEINLNNVMPAQAGIHNLSVKVYDVLGIEHPATAWHTSTEGNVRIDVSALPKGVYFVSVGGAMNKFVKI